MKKFVLVALLVIVVAAPAFAGLAPETPAAGTINQATAGGNGRSAVYAPNDPGHVYDMMPNSAAGPPGGPEDLRYQVTQNPASGAFCNLINLKPGATNITNAHIIIDGRASAVTPFTFAIAFRNDVGPGPYPVGAFLNTTGGTSAFFAYTLTNTLTLWTLNFPTVSVTQRNIWVCVQGTQAFRVRTGTQSGNELNGNLGDAANGSRYIGSSIGGTYISSFGVGIGSASTMASSFTFGNPQVGNWHMALGGAPEPATAALLGLIGLVAMRRRKIKA
jgi:hypothetical protein